MVTVGPVLFWFCFRFNILKQQINLWGGARKAFKRQWNSKVLKKHSLGLGARFPVSIKRENKNFSQGESSVRIHSFLFTISKISYLPLLTHGAISTAVAASPISTGLEAACQLSLEMSVLPHNMTCQENRLKVMAEPPWNQGRYQDISRGGQSYEFRAPCVKWPIPLLFLVRHRTRVHAKIRKGKWITLHSMDDSMSVSNQLHTYHSPYLTTVN